MQYYVIAQDGQKYGPADVPTLAQWATEGRINPNTMLESMVDASRVPASSVPGVIAQAAQTSNPYANPPATSNPYIHTQAAPTANYQRPAYGVSDDGSADITKAWIFGSLAFVPCFCPLLFGILGIVFANNGRTKGHPKGQTALIFSIVGLVVGIGFGFIVRLLLFSGLSPLGR